MKVSQQQTERRLYAIGRVKALQAQPPGWELRLMHLIVCHLRIARVEANGDYGL
jgi:hypothetical protein